MNDELGFWGAVLGWAAVILIITFLSEGFWIIMQHVNTGNATYRGTLIGTAHHGIFWETYGASFKTSKDSNFIEPFCTSKETNDKLKQLPTNARVEVSYYSLFATPSWRCDFLDSSDIITDVRVIE